MVRQPVDISINGKFNSTAGKVGITVVAYNIQFYIMSRTSCRLGYPTCHSKGSLYLCREPLSCSGPYMYSYRAEIPSMEGLGSVHNFATMNDSSTAKRSSRDRENRRDRDAPQFGGAGSGAKTSKPPGTKSNLIYDNLTHENTIPFEHWSRADSPAMETRRPAGTRAGRCRAGQSEEPFDYEPPGPAWRKFGPAARHGSASRSCNFMFGYPASANRLFAASVFRRVPSGVVLWKHSVVREVQHLGVCSRRTSANEERRGQTGSRTRICNKNFLSVRRTPYAVRRTPYAVRRTPYAVR
ncbi:unnamed protein product, partial [Nesidiocoris tenuis]